MANPPINQTVLAINTDGKSSPYQMLKGSFNSVGKNSECFLYALIDISVMGKAIEHWN
jgi:hypothetical protein